MRTTRKRYTCESQERYYRNAPRRHRHDRSTNEAFKCKNCRCFIGSLPTGGHHRNHCPICLYSRHVDISTGDRLSACGARMAPIGYFQRANGEYVLVHRCLGCGFERFNRVAADDNFDLVLSLPELPPRTSRESKAQQVQTVLDNWPGTEAVREE